MRVLIVGANRMLAEAVRVALVANGWEAWAVAATGAHPNDVFPDGPADVVLVDVTPPHHDRIDLGRRVLVEWPGTKVVAFGPTDDHSVTRQVTAAGFHGFFPRSISISDMVVHIEAVVAGKFVLPQPDLPKPLRLAESRDRSFARLVSSGITRRERQVIELLSAGASKATIASALLISPYTVRTHIQNILVKMQVHSQLEAVAFAIRHRLIRPSEAPEAESILEWAPQAVVAGQQASRPGLPTAWVTPDAWETPFGASMVGAGAATG